MPLSRIIRRAELSQYLGLRDTALDEKLAKGEMPQPVKLSDSGRGSGWLESELISYQEYRIARRDNTTAARSWQEFHVEWLAKQPLGTPT